MRPQICGRFYFDHSKGRPAYVCKRGEFHALCTLHNFQTKTLYKLTIDFFL